MVQGEVNSIKQQQRDSDNCCNWTRIICANCDAVRAAPQVSTLDPGHLEQERERGGKRESAWCGKNEKLTSLAPGGVATLLPAPGRPAGLSTPFTVICFTSYANFHFHYLRERKSPLARSLARSSLYHFPIDNAHSCCQCPLPLLLPFPPTTSLFSNCQIKTGKMLNLISEALKKRRNAEQASKTK